MLSIELPVWPRNSRRRLVPRVLKGTQSQLPIACGRGLPVAAWVPRVPKGTSTQLPIACDPGFPVAAWVPGVPEDTYLNPAANSHFETSLKILW